jgi:hypothetical protein
MNSMSQSNDDQATALGSLEAAYAQGYRAAETIDPANRALVYRYIATSSHVVARELRTTGGRVDLADQADRFAAAAKEKDPVVQGSAIYQMLKPLIPAGAALGVISAGVIAIGAIVTQVGQAGAGFGASLGTLTITGGVAYGLWRMASVAASGAARAGESASEAVAEAFRSTSASRLIVFGLGSAEQALLGAGAPLKRAQRDRILISLSGPLAALLVTLAIAVPIVLGAIFVVSAAGGYESSHESFHYTPPELSTPELELPSEYE